ncbi:hypothetical protein ACU8V7_26485 [Zobellia nedashkovskayae]
MTLKSEIKPPAWFWIITVLALLWNLMGVSAYLMDAFMSVEDLGKLPQDQRLLYESRPIWVTSAYAIAVWAGALGCIALLFRKKMGKDTSIDFANWRTCPKRISVFLEQYF